MKKSYLKSVGYFVGSIVVSSMNDIISKYIVTSEITPFQLTFCRVASGTLFLLLYGWVTGKLKEKQPYWWRHVIRGSLFVIAITLWSYSLQYVEVPTATIMSFSIPIFVLLLSPWVVQERVPLRLWLPTGFGLLGIGLVLRPNLSWSAVNGALLALFASVILFAFLDVLNKKFVAEESLFSIIFYSNIVSMLWVSPMAYQKWVPLTMPQGMGLLLLGLGGNLIIYLILKAYRHGEIVALAPVRYLELFISMGLSYGFFGDLPQKGTLLGALVIIPSVLFIIYDQHKKKAP